MFPDGYEAQILHRARPVRGNTTGTLVRFSPGKDTLIKPDEWVGMEVIAQDNRIIVKVNGATTVNYVDPIRSYTRGCIALQLMDPGSVVQFRKIEVKRLPKTNPP